MNLIERVKNILISPKTEWQKIAAEPQPMGTVITTYVLPLVLIGAVATFIGYGFIGINYGFLKIAGVDWGLRMACVQLISALLGVVITAYVVDALAPSFGSEKNIDKSTQLVAYGYTPAFVGAIFNIFPAIAIIGSLLSLYGIYVMYLGFTPMKKTPEDKRVTYFIVTIIILIVLYFVLGLILGSLLSTRLRY
jgi:hypothetical protein